MHASHQTVECIEMKQVRTPKEKLIIVSRMYLLLKKKFEKEKSELPIDVYRDTFNHLEATKSALQEKFREIRAQ